MIACNFRRRRAAFTFVEILVAMGISGAFAAALLSMWSTLGFSALNATTFSRRQNDQMRVLDYMKRDIRRATDIQLYNGETLVTGNGAATELRLTIPGFYADTREEDDAFGPKTTNAPVVTGSTVTYGTPLPVRYYALRGAGIRREQTVSRTVSDGAGAFEFSFQREATGAIRCLITFDQPMRGGATRSVRRQVSTVCIPRFELQR